MDNLKEQFGGIYDQYIGKIYRFVYLKVNSQEIAEDLTSKVFLKGWEAYQSKSEIKNVRAFLYQIARNTVIDYYRGKGRTKTIPAEFASEIIDPRVSAHDKAVLNADINIIKTAIQKLSKEHQDIIIWHYLDDMTIPEVAKLLGRPEGTVRVMLHRGLKDLKNIIEEA